MSTTQILDIMSELKQDDRKLTEVLICLKDFCSHAAACSWLSNMGKLELV